MEDQDRMLVQTLRGFGFAVEEAVQSLAQLTGDALVLVALQFLEKMGASSVKVSSLRSLKGSKFRQISRLQEDLASDYGIRVDVQSLLNPNPNDTRKLVVNFLSKVSAADDKGKPLNTTLTIEERVEEERRARYKDTLHQFTKEQWINPSLLNHEINNQRFLRLHVKNILGKETLLSQVSNPGLRHHLYNSISSHLKRIDRVIGRDQPPKFEGWQGNEQLQTKIQLIKKLRRQDDPDAFLTQYKGQFEETGETSEWAQIQQGGRTIQKAIKLMKEEDVEEEQSRKEIEQENQNIFTLEIQFQKEIVEEAPPAQQSQPSQQTVTNAISTIEGDLQQLRRSNRENIDLLSAQLGEKEAQLTQLINRRTKVDETIQRKTDQLNSLLHGNQQLQKQLETQHMMLSQIESKTALQELDTEITKLEQENETIQNEWFKQKLEIEGDINTLRQKTQERKERLLQYKEKIKRLEEENKVVKVEGRQNLEKKDQLIEEFQKMPKEIARLVYVRKILDLGQNLKKQQAEYQKVKKELAQLEEQIDFQTNTINRYYTELENLFQTDPKKKEPVVGQIMQKYQEYRTLFRDTMASVREISQRKIEAQEIEVKVDQIHGKGYKLSIEKLQSDLAAIKQENQRYKTR